MKVLLVLVLAIATVSAGTMLQDVPMHPLERPAVAANDGRITNGRYASEGQFPYQVSLFFSGKSNWFCGGSIIDNQWILTAAHCTNGASYVTIYYGSTTRQAAKLVHTVSSSNFIIHAQFHSTYLNNDISLIRTPVVTFTNYINKIRLPSMASSYSTYAGQWAIASGWGKTSDSAAGVTDYLMWANFEVISVATCQAYVGAQVATHNVLCIATPGRTSTCQGDSGGPLALASNYHLIGITSFGSNYGCESNQPKGFTRVTSYLDWIKYYTNISY